MSNGEVLSNNPELPLQLHGMEIASIGEVRVIVPEHTIIPIGDHIGLHLQFQLPYPGQAVDADPRLVMQMAYAASVAARLLVNDDVPQDMVPFDASGSINLSIRDYTPKTPTTDFKKYENPTLDLFARSLASPNIGKAVSSRGCLWEGRREYTQQELTALKLFGKRLQEETEGMINDSEGVYLFREIRSTPQRLAAIGRPESSPNLFKSDISESYDSTPQYAGDIILWQMGRYEAVIQPGKPLLNWPTEGIHIVIKNLDESLAHTGFVPERTCEQLALSMGILRLSTGLYENGQVDINVNWPIWKAVHETPKEGIEMMIADGPGSKPQVKKFSHDELIQYIKTHSSREVLKALLRGDRSRDVNKRRLGLSVHTHVQMEGKEGDFRLPETPVEFRAKPREAFNWDELAAPLRKAFNGDVKMSDPKASVLAKWLKINFKKALFSSDLK